MINPTSLHSNQRPSVNAERKGRFFCFEGLCGTGKTTTAQLLAEKLGGVVMPLFDQRFAEVRPMIDRETNVEAHYLFYLAMAMLAEPRISQIMKEGKDVVVDSYYFRTEAFHRGMGAQSKVLLPPKLLQPSLGFYLGCQPDVRAKRIVARKSMNLREKSKGFWDRLAEESTASIEAEYNKFNLQYIDTTHKSPDEVAQEAFDIISNI